MDLLTQPETAEETRLSERTLERHRLAGTGPKFVRLGRRVLYRLADVEEWIAENICRSTSEADAMAVRRRVGAAWYGTLRTRRPSDSRLASRRRHVAHPSM